MRKGKRRNEIMKSKPRYCVAQVWMNGVKTVQTFDDMTYALQHAQNCTLIYKGNLIYLGTLVEQSLEPMEDDE